MPARVLAALRLEVAADAALPYPELQTAARRATAAKARNAGHPLFLPDAALVNASPSRAHKIAGCFRPDP